MSSERRYSGVCTHIGNRCQFHGVLTLSSLYNAAVLILILTSLVKVEVYVCLGMSVREMP